MAGDVDRRAAIQLRLSEIQTQIRDRLMEADPWAEEEDVEVAKLEAERDALIGELQA